MPVGRRKSWQRQRLGLGLLQHGGLLLGLLLHIFTAPACAQFSASGSASGNLPFLGSSDGSGESYSTSGSGDFGMHLFCVCAILISHVSNSLQNHGVHVVYRRDVGGAAVPLCTYNAQVRANLGVNLCA